MNPLHKTKNTKLNRVIDVIVILAIGMVIGMTAAQYLNTDSITTTRVIQRVPLRTQDAKQEAADTQEETVTFNEI